MFDAFDEILKMVQVANDYYVVNLKKLDPLFEDAKKSLYIWL